MSENHITEPAVIVVYGILLYIIVWYLMVAPRAERRAWAVRHPRHQMRGCMFHFTQNLWKYINRAGFSTLYSQNSPQGKQFKGRTYLMLLLYMKMIMDPIFVPQGSAGRPSPFLCVPMTGLKRHFNT